MHNKTAATLRTLNSSASHEVAREGSRGQANLKNGTAVGLSKAQRGIFSRWNSGKQEAALITR